MEVLDTEIDYLKLFMLCTLQNVFGTPRGMVFQIENSPKKSLKHVYKNENGGKDHLTNYLVYWTETGVVKERVCVCVCTHMCDVY